VRLRPHPYEFKLYFEHLSCSKRACGERSCNSPGQVTFRLSCASL